MANHLLSFLVFIPLLAAFFLLFVPHAKENFFKWVILGVSVVEIVIAGLIGYLFQSQPDKGLNHELAVLLPNFHFQMVEKADWIDLNLGSLGRLSIDYFLAVDGLSISLIILSAVILFIGAIASFTINKHLKGYAILFLLLSAAIMGCFVALDFFLFYLFFEFMLLPMYFLIGLWGGPRREYASIKFFLYTLLGSIFILIVMIGLYNSVIDPIETGKLAGIIGEGGTVTTEQLVQVQAQVQAGTIPGTKLVHTFNMAAMMNSANFIPDSILDTVVTSMLWGVPVRFLAFLALLIGFSIKLPAVPLHSWLPDAHVEAPTAISVILAGILLKIGGYGLIRIGFSIFPEGAIHYAWWIGFFGVLAIIYGALNALAMKDLKKLIAYSSVSHMGFVLLGLASLTVEGTSGSLYQMFSHGLITAMLFLIAGVLYDRTDNRLIANFGGLTSAMPHFTAVVIIAFFASLGLPGFSGFIAELLVFLGAFNSATVNMLIPRWMAIVATLGLLLSAGYYLWTLQRMFFGEYYLREDIWHSKLTDLNFREYAMFIPLIIAVIVFGIFPSLFLDMVSDSVNNFVGFVLNTGQTNLKLILGQ